MHMFSGNIGNKMIKLKISEKELADAICFDLKKIVKKIESKNENIYAIAFVTDEYIQSFNIFVGTEQSLMKQIDYYRKKVYRNSKESDIDGLDSELRWNPAEWCYDCDDVMDSKVVKISQELFHNKAERSAEVKAEFYELISSVVKKLDESEELNLSSKRNNITLFISSLDDDNSIDIENYSAKLLNSKKIYNRFKSRYDE